MTHSGPSITSTQQILPCEFLSGPLLARTRNFADVIAMAPGAASEYFIGKWMPGGGRPIVQGLKGNHIRDQYIQVACVGRLTSISCGTTGPVAVLFVNGGYFQIFVAMFNISALRCARHCPSAALHTPPTAVGSTFICSLWHPPWASLLCVLFLLARFLFVRAHLRRLNFWWTAMYHASLLIISLRAGVVATSPF